jgi:hypothetical protein
VYWLRKAAEKGRADAQCELGYMYKKGRGVARDDEQAMYWFHKAAEQGYVDGQCELSYMFRDGRGVEKNDGHAVYWVRKAAEQGDSYAQDTLRKLGIDWEKK